MVAPRLRLSLLAAALLLGGCAAPKVTLGEGPREYVATDYDAVLDRWTRTERLFALPELETYLTATATFDGPTSSATCKITGSRSTSGRSSWRRRSTRPASATSSSSPSTGASAGTT